MYVVDIRLACSQQLTTMDHLTRTELLSCVSSEVSVDGFATCE